MPARCGAPSPPRLGVLVGTPAYLGALGSVARAGSEPVGAVDWRLSADSGKSEKTQFKRYCSDPTTRPRAPRTPRTWPWGLVVN
jgi:hypothetical protein